MLVLEHGPRAARKVLVSGGGQCNFTNLNADFTRYQSDNPDFPRSALSRFTPRTVLDLLHEHRIDWEEREDGKIFLTQSAARVVEALVHDCRESGAKVLFGQSINSVKKQGDAFEISTVKGVFSGKRLVVATGGKSWKSLGSTGFGYQLARQFGHDITELRPGLVPLVLSGKTVFMGLSGISFRAGVTTARRTFSGDVLVTHRGLSGPAVLQASSFWRESESLLLNFMPGEDAGNWLVAHGRERIELKNLLAQRLPRRLAHGLAAHCGGSAPMHSLSERRLRLIAEVLGAFELIPSGTEGFGHAEVTVGGVDTRHVSSKNMESLITPGLFFIGELLDVTGELGGFNLHWAWASALATGEHI